MIFEQFLPALHYGDAIGQSTLRLHTHLTEKGYRSRIIALTVDEQLKDRACLFSDYQEEEDSIKILHFAVPSQLTDYFLDCGGKKVLIYHNVTPPRFFVDFSDTLVRFTAMGSDHLRRLTGCFDLVVADSDYNARELEAMGFPEVFRFPIMIDMESYRTPHSRAFVNLLADERKNIIFIGRISPNKKIEDLIKVLFFYKKYISPAIRLIVAGKTSTVDRYFQALVDLAARFHLTAEDLVFTGHIPFRELLSVYELGDLFLSMSEHEGFCLPLIESALFRVPVVAYDAGAVAETLKGSGLIVNSKRPDYLAGLIAEIFRNSDLRDHMRSRQKTRIDDYAAEAVPDRLLDRLLEI